MRQAFCIEDYYHRTSEYYECITHVGEIVWYNVDDTHYILYGEISVSHEVFKRYFIPCEKLERKEKLKRLAKFNTNNTVD